MDREITYIATSDIMEHPKNPRKDLGDLSELTESIRQHGIMQNLIVIDRKDALEGLKAEYKTTPSQILAETMEKLQDSKEKYVVLLGHRRLAAALEADLNEVPCIIEENLTLNEQISLMLLENMQRNNLTIIEEAESFQMMLDLGDTVKSVSAKTGFSESTVRHRTELAKLDKDALHTALLNAEEQGYQITLADLAKLEKIDDIKERNRILDGAYNSSQIDNGVRQYLDNKKIAEDIITAEKIILDKIGVEIGNAPKDYSPWNSKYESVLEIGQDAEKTFNSKKGKAALKNLPEDAFIAKQYGRLMLCVKKSKKALAEETPEQKAQKEREKRKRELRALQKNMVHEWQEWLIGIIDAGKQSQDKKNIGLIQEALSFLEQTNVWIECDAIAEHFLPEGVERWNAKDLDRQRARQKVKDASALARILWHAAQHFVKNDLFTYMAEPDESMIEAAGELADMLTDYGYEETNADYIRLINGTHELYAKKGK